MKKIFIFSIMLGCVGISSAQEVGRVISSTPVIQQTSVPKQVCTTEQVSVENQKSGAGALMGAIAGGAVGNSMGNGSGKAAATALGLFGGAILGDRIEGSPGAHMQTVQRCTTQNVFENRIMHYNVVYEFNGKQYNVQMPSDPGPTIRLQVTPMSANSVTSPSLASTSTAIIQAVPVYISRPATPLVMNTGFIWGGNGHRGHGHGGFGVGMGWR